MDYKTTILKKEIQTDETLLPEIAGLHFGFLEENRAVFDYTAYIEENKLVPIDFKVFMRVNKHFIETLANLTIRKHQNCFFKIPMVTYWYQQNWSSFS